MNSKAYKSFFLISEPDKGEKEEEQAMPQDYYLVPSQPLIFNSKKCLKQRKKKKVGIMTVESPKQAA